MYIPSEKRVRGGMNVVVVPRVQVKDDGAQNARPQGEVV